MDFCGTDGRCPGREASMDFGPLPKSCLDSASRLALLAFLLLAAGGAKAEFLQLQ